MGHGIKGRNERPAKIKKKPCLFVKGAGGTTELSKVEAAAADVPPLLAFSSLNSI